MRLTFFLAAGLIACGTTGVAQDGPGIDPKAIEIAKASSDYLAGQSQISFGWFVTYDTIEDGREKRTSVWTGESAIVRGEGYRSSSIQGRDARDYVFDGTTFTAVFAGEGQFAQIEAPGSFEQLNATLLQDYALELPMADIIDQSGSAAGFVDLTDAVYVGEVFFGDQTAHHLAFRRYEGDWEMWISTDPANPVPLMISGADPYAHGWPKFNAVLFDWDFAAELGDAPFQFAAPESFEQITLTPVAELAQ